MIRPNPKWRSNRARKTGSANSRKRKIMEVAKQALPPLSITLSPQIPLHHLLLFFDHPFPGTSSPLPNWLFHLFLNFNRFLILYHLCILLLIHINLNYSIKDRIATNTHLRPHTQQRLNRGIVTDAQSGPALPHL